MIGFLSACFSLASSQGLDLPKIEAVLMGSNSTVADAEVRWQSIAAFIKQRIEIVNPQNIDEFHSMLAKDGLQGNRSASFQFSVMPIHDRNQGFFVWMNVTSRAEPQKYSRQATFLFLWEKRHVVANFISGPPLLKSGYLAEGAGTQRGNLLLLGGTNPMISGEGGYGPTIAVAFRRNSKGWLPVARAEIGTSGRLENIRPDGQLSFWIFAKQSSVLRSTFDVPTLTEVQGVRFNGKKFELLRRQPLRNKYWVMSEFIKALQKGDRTSAIKLVESAKVVDIALKAGVGFKNIVWETTEEKRGDDHGIQINANIGEVWHSVSFWFKGSSSKMFDATQNRPM